MSTRLYAPTKAKSTSTSSFTPVRGGLLQRKCACGGAPGLDGLCAECRSKQLTGQRQPLVQTKLTIAQPNDAYEQEADRVADVVMRMPEPRVQRQGEAPEEDKDEEKMLQAKSVSGQITPLLQRQAEVAEEEKEEEKELIQPKQHPGQTPEVTPDLESRINALRGGGGQPLDPATRAFMDPRFGYDFSQVRIHPDSRAAKTAQAVSARAFTVGQDVVFGAGQYASGTTEGKRLLAHELTHVVQQSDHAGSLAQSIPIIQRHPILKALIRLGRAALPLLQRAGSAIIRFFAVNGPRAWAYMRQFSIEIAQRVWLLIRGSQFPNIVPRAVDIARGDPNRVNHIFGRPEHLWRLTGLTQ